MKVDIVRTYYSGWPGADVRFAVILGNHRVNFGVAFHGWGLRIMFGWWHLCVSKMAKIEEGEGCREK